MKRIQMRLNMTIPVISHLFAVEYVFICCLPGSRRSENQGGHRAG
jgi:hypothetical protein